MSGLSSGSINYLGNVVVGIQGSKSPYLDFLMTTGTTREGDVQWPTPASGSINGITVNITGNALSATLTLTLRKNGVNTGLALKITSGTTGIVSNGTQVIFNKNDLLDWAVSCTDSTNTIGFIPVIEVQI